MISCEICKSILARKKIKFPSFRHHDFSTVSNNTSFEVCNNCKIYFNIENHNLENKIFNSNNYAKNHKFISRKIYNKKLSNKFTSRASVQFNILKNKIKQSSSILEVGCNDGELLFRIQKKFKKIKIFGVDTKPFKYFYKNSKINFVNIEEINKIKNQKFDILIFAQSIYYISPLIISHYLDMVKKDGVVYVEIPDFNINPHSILMGDVYFVPFVESIKKILAQNKFKINFIKNSKLDRELIIIGKRGINKKKNNKINIDKYIKIFEKDKKKICEIKEKYLIFGNSCKSAFLDEVSNNCLGFTVNNPNFEKFRKKKNLKMNKEIKKLIVFSDKKILKNQLRAKLVLKNKNYKLI